MTGERLGDSKRSVERWDDVFEALAAEPRRRLVVSLLDEPTGRRISLPDAATLDSMTGRERRAFALALKHRHLPVLSDRGFVDWTTDPFCAQRGWRFDEVAAVVDALESNGGELPLSLLEGCPRLESDHSRE
ncbi:hypothetical protein [Natronobacterium texcoconense]|uniref:Transcriptional regulator n=1 Tax=Natronobacterium texcoconense TaxID=1095778 RepID=A0A1H1FJE9_NATTX|nr:hypothetical protein [Natronobacterium texcoconense]SDR00974.1 hypothetical protein SAMN04489842_1990 [Natronobacterium texcoconense]